MNNGLLQIENLSVNVENKPILKNVNLQVNKGEIHAIMGKNGSGKTTLAFTIIGHPKYQISSGKILFNNEDITQLQTDERARLGIFLTFQYPIAIPGVTVANFIRSALKMKTNEDIPVVNFRKTLIEVMKELQIDESFAYRYINDGFSGGEKKRIEILQMSILKPQLTILDEIDSGLDIDAIKVVSENINSIINKNPQFSIIVITHYPRILKYIQPHYVHILLNGKIVKSGDKSLTDTLEQKGYEVFEN